MFTVFQKLSLNLNRLDKAYSVEGENMKFYGAFLCIQHKNIKFYGAFLCIQQHLKISMGFYEPWQEGYIAKD
jgi:hypothetical protein